MKSFLHLWLRIFDYRGVTSRSQYLIALVLNLLLPWFTVIFATILGYDYEISLALMFCYYILSFIPCISLTVRRLHDHSLSGAFIFFALIPGVGWIILFILTLLGTVKVNNRWRIRDIQRGYIKSEILANNLTDRPLSDIG